jgi:hypothetical protein
VFDVANHADDMNNWGNASRVAENDFSLAYKFTRNFSAKANYAERNFQAYYSGSNFPSLFSVFERDKHRSYGGSATYSRSRSFAVTGGYRHIYRESFGSSNRFGGELRWNSARTGLVSGISYHRVNTSDVKWVDPARPSFSLSHHDARAWAMYDKAKFTASLDGMVHVFDDKNNPNLNGQSCLYEAVASIGARPNAKLRVSADAAFGATSMAKAELRGLLRIDYKFGFAGFKGGW